MAAFTSALLAGGAAAFGNWWSNRRKPVMYSRDPNAPPVGIAPRDPNAPVTAPPPITLASGATVPVGTPAPPDARALAFQASSAARSAAMRQRRKAAGSFSSQKLFGPGGAAASSMGGVAGGRRPRLGGY